MLESGVPWIESLTQMFIVVSLCFSIQKTTGYRKIWNKIPSWIPVAVIYSIWNAYNVIVLHYTELITDFISEPVAYKIRAITGLMVAFIILPWFYNGSLVERYFAWFIIELVSLISGFSRYIIWILISANKGLYNFLNVHLFLMLFFRVTVELAPYFLFCFIFRKQLKKYSVYIKKHKKLCYAAIVFIVLIEVFSAFFAISNSIQQIWRETAGSLFLFAVMGIVIYMLKKENRCVNLQKQFLENHYQSVKNQEEQIEEMQSEIGELLRSASDLEEQMQYSVEDLKYYAKELKSIYKKLQRVDYCDNLILDAVIHNKVKECEEKNIILDIEVQDIDIGNIQDIDIFEVMYVMLEIAISQAQMQENDKLRHITVSGKNLAGQVVMEIRFYLVSDILEERVKQYKRLKRKIRRMGGQCVNNTVKNAACIVAGIPCM